MNANEVPALAANAAIANMGHSVVIGLVVLVVAVIVYAAVMLRGV